MRAFEWVSSQVWAMPEESLRGILEIAARENPSVEAVEAKLGRPLDNTQTTTVRDGIAIIPIEGPIFPKANLMTEVSGATSVQVAARDFNAAVNDKSIDGIILNVDSPGGDITGIHEFSQMIFDARGKKPIKTYCGGLIASAAYAIGSASEEIIVDRTATAGSLGIRMSVPDPSKRAAKDVEIVSSQSPKKRVDVSTESGKAILQARLNEHADILLGYVARNRGVAVETLLAIEGDVRIGENAVAAKLADRTGSLESLIKEMSAAAAAAKEKNMSVSFMTRLRAVLSGAPIVAEESTAAKTSEQSDLEAALAEVQSLRAKAVQADTLLAEKAEAIEKERKLRIKTEVASFMKEHSDRLGAAAFTEVEKMLTEAKEAKADDLAGRIEALVKALPLVGSGRIPAGGANVDREVALAAGDAKRDSDAERDAKITERAKKGGISYEAAYALVMAEEKEKANAA